MGEVGFVGLGVMGAPMAAHLAKAGHFVVAWNRTAAKAARVAESGVEVAASIEVLAERCGVIMICVSRTEDVRECVEAMAPCAQPGTLFVDHSTISPVGAKVIHDDLRRRNLRFVDAPITGGSMGARSGQLTVFCGGDAPDVEAAIPYIRAYAKRVERVGGPGAGQMMKMANQIAVGGALLGLCESLAFAQKAGLDLRQAKEMIGAGAAGSWAFENYGPKVLDQDWSPGFSVNNQRKDFGYCAEAARQIDASIPGALLVNELLGDLEQGGQGEWTTAALFDVLMRRGANS